MMKLLLPFFLLTANAHEGHDHSKMDQNRPQPLSGESIYNVDQEWRDQDGKKMKLADLKGSPVILAMIYTSCQSACPLIVSHVQSIESKVTKAERGKMKFILVSFDPARDTPKKLLAFSKSRKLDMSRWKLVTGNETAVRQIAAVLDIKYRREKNGDFSHSNVITLLDSGGVVRQQIVGLDSNDQTILDTLKRL